jgi:hypothetical protein
MATPATINLVPGTAGTISGAGTNAAREAVTLPSAGASAGYPFSDAQIQADWLEPQASALD